MSGRTCVAFMQNQWFKDPARAKAFLEARPDCREGFIKRALFMGCLSGRRLEEGLGVDLCQRIIWEEASDKIGGQSAAAFPADPAHIRRVLEKHEPRVAVAFGRIAEDGLEFTRRWRVTAEQPNPNPQIIITGPHPAARGPGVMETLKRIRRNLEELHY